MKKVRGSIQWLDLNDHQFYWVHNGLDFFYRNHGTIMDPKNNALKDEFTRSYDDLMVFSWEIPCEKMLGNWAKFQVWSGLGTCEVGELGSWHQHTVSWSQDCEYWCGAAIFGHSHTRMLGNLSSPVSSRVHLPLLLAAIMRRRQAYLVLSGVVSVIGWLGLAGWWPVQATKEAMDGWMDGWLIELSVKLVGLAKMQ